MVSSIRAVNDRVPGPDRGELFDASYYATRFGPKPYARNEEWLAFFGGIAEEIIRSLRPSRVFDAGCAMGMLVESLWDRGLEACGVDISPYAISSVRRDMQPYCRVASITEPLSGSFDLITCIEVLEHMPEGEARLAIGEMTKASDAILFSSSPDDLVEPTHINVHPLIYWLKLFEEYGFQPDLVYDAGFVAPHAMLFRKAQQRLDEDVLVLFARNLRFKIALVERERRIGGLNEQLAQSAAALRDAESRVAQLNADLVNKTRAADYAGAAVERIGADLEAARGRLAEANNRIGSLEGSKASLEAAHAALEERLRAVENAREAAEHSLAAASNHGVELEDMLARGEAELKAVRERAVEAASSFAGIEAENTALRQQNMQLAETSSELKGEMVAIHQSPGWQLILRYRNWLRAARVHSSWVRRWYEPAASRLIRRLTRKGSDAVLPTVLSAMRADTDSAVTVSPSDASEPALLPYEHWILLNEPSAAELGIQRQISRQLAYRPKISIIVPVYRVPPSVLAKTLDSVLNQTYDHWELCVVDADPEGTDNRARLSALAASDDRIKVEFLDSNLGIAGNSNRAFAMSTGEFVALLDHDDSLAPFALFEVLKKLNQDPRLDFIFSDKDQLSEDGTQRIDPLFKPGWSPDLVLSANYLTHLCVLRAEIVRSIGGWRSETDGAQDWDLFLRAIQDPERIAHIPKVLYHWRRISTSVATRGLEAKPYAAAAQQTSVQAYLEQQGWKATAAFTDSGLIQLRWKPGRRLRAAIIVLCSDAEEDPGTYFARVFPPADYPGLEVFLVPCAAPLPSRRLRDARLRVVPYDENASLASRLNDAVRESSGEVLIFLDQGVQAGVDTWLTELIAPLEQPGIGITGCKLFDLKTCQIRHAGICFNSDGELAYPFASETDYIHNAFGGANWYRNWLAVSGACFAIRRDVFDSVGGFSPRPVFPRLDVDLCLKVVLDTGRRVFYNPFARMWQTRRAVLERWLHLDGPAAGARYISSSFPNGDPFFNPNLVSKEGRIALRKPGDRRAQPLADHNYAKESRLLVKAFDCVPAEIQESIASCSRPARLATKHFTWFIPEFRHPFYGGIHTVLRFADFFRRVHGIRSSFVVLGHAHPAAIRRAIAAVSQELAASSAVEVLDDYAGLARLEPSDAAIATLWTTAYYVLRYNRSRQKFYFLQDHESLFYPAGSTSALVDATWGFGFKGLCNTVTLRDLYVQRGGEAEFFAPCVDGDVFYPRVAQDVEENKPQTLFCYARPNHSRNCFELLIESLRILKRRLGEKVVIVTAGEQWDPAQFGVDGLVHNLGVLDYRATGALYRSCDAGVIMMTTAHPSYLPLELMACGSLVVTNENPSTSWLLQDRVNCLLARTTPAGVAEVIEEGLRNHGLRRRITETAARMVTEQYVDWDGAAEKVFRYISQAEGVA